MCWDAHQHLGESTQEEDEHELDTSIGVDGEVAAGILAGYWEIDGHLL